MSKDKEKQPIIFILDDKEIEEDIYK